MTRIPALHPVRTAMPSPAPMPPPARVAPSDHVFAELLDACRPSGGLARHGEVAGRAARRRPDSAAWLDDCLRRRALIAFDWHAGPWLPLFQFEPSDMSLREAVRPALAQLGHVMDGWELAAWFVRPQCVLQHRAPMDLLDTQPALVMAAARQAHFVRAA